MTSPQAVTTAEPAVEAGPGIRVLLYVRAPEGGAAAVERAYHEVSATLAGTPGLLRNELLREVRDRDGFAVLSEWESRAAFQAWEEGPSHRGNTSPLRPFKDRVRGRHYGIYEVTATYRR